MKNNPIVITSGDPNGIGLDIIVDIINADFPTPLHILSDKEQLAARAAQLKKPLRFSKHIYVEHIPLNQTENEYVFSQLTRATTGCLKKEFAALVTCPVNKAKLNQTHPFCGHTEWLRDFTKTPFVVMCLTNPKLTVALLTTHLPLSEVPSAITSENITKTLRILRQSFPHKKIMVCGLNPHAGEGGLLGQEEARVIKPTLAKLNDPLLIGPVPADTAFAMALNRDVIILAMYHDQGLAPVKAIDFYRTVNMTLGLPFVRTSVDHGTAYELVGSGKASSQSLITAIHSAAHYASQ